MYLPTEPIALFHEGKQRVNLRQFYCRLICLNLLFYSFFFVSGKVTLLVVAHSILYFRLSDVHALITNNKSEIIDHLLST